MPELDSGHVASMPAGEDAASQHWVLHVDLDQFIAAVEMLRRPELRGRPVVVGGDGDPTKRGVVSTASYEAREYGVHSGLPLRTAARRCPDAVFLPVDREVYEKASEEVMTALRGFGATTEVMGWDEAFVAVDTDDPEQAARQIAARIRAETSLDCHGRHRAEQAAGQAGHRLRQAGRRVPADPRATGSRSSGHGRPTRCGGSGPRRPERLAVLGIGTVSELAAADPAALAAEFGPVTGPWLIQLARGISHSPVTSEPWLARSRSREETFQRNIEDWDQVRAEVVRLAGGWPRTWPPSSARRSASW